MSRRVLTVFCLCFVAAACSDEDSNTPTMLNADDDPIQVTEAISEMVGRLEVRVDPRIELINIVENAESFEEKHLREPTMKQEIMYERLKEYEANRDKYPDLHSFYPRIVELLAELSLEDVK